MNQRDILARNESKVQTGNFYGDRFCSDGSLLRLRGVLLPPVSIKSVASVVH